jgi:hypothetical protein
MSSPPEKNADIEQLKNKIQDLKKQLPKHSTPPSMLIELEELEERLGEALKKLSLKGDDA